MKKQQTLSLAEKLKAKEALAQQLVEQLKAKDAEQAADSSAESKAEVSLTDNNHQKHDFKNIIGCGG